MSDHSSRSIYPDIKTAAERDKIELMKPANTLELRPDASTALEQSRASRDAQAQRLRDLVDALEGAKTKLDYEHAFAILKGRPRAHFDRER